MFCISVWEWDDSKARHSGGGRTRRWALQRRVWRNHDGSLWESFYNEGARCEVCEDSDSPHGAVTGVQVHNHGWEQGESHELYSQFAGEFPQLLFFCSTEDCKQNILMYNLRLSLQILCSIITWADSQVTFFILSFVLTFCVLFTLRILSDEWNFVERAICIYANTPFHQIIRTL